MQKLKALKNKVGKYEGLVTTYEDILTLIEMGIEEQDDSVYEEVKEMNDSFLAEYEALRIATMLDGEYDRNNAIVTLHAGTGGTEALGLLLDLVYQPGQPAQQGGQLIQQGVSLLKQAGEQPKDTENQSRCQQQGENSGGKAASKSQLFSTPQDPGFH